MKLEKIINKALKDKIPARLAWVYQEFYSPYYNLMRLLAGTIHNGVLVELGVHKGRGLASLAAGNPTNTVIGFDTLYYQTEIDAVIKTYPNVLFFQKPSLPVPIDITGSINLLHIDTEHSYAMAKAEFEAYQPYLANGAYVLFDDLHAMDDEVLSYFNSLPFFKRQDDRLHPICGYGVMIYGRNLL